MRQLMGSMIEPPQASTVTEYYMHVSPCDKNVHKQEVIQNYYIQTYS